MMKRIFNERKFTAVVRLLDGDEFQTEVTKSTLGRDIFELVCQHVGLEETDFFGLKFVCPKDRQLSWLDHAKTVGKQMGNGPYHLAFHVKFYPPNPAAVNEDLTRYQIVLQVRDDLLKKRLICSVPIHALLASFLIQAEKGDYDPAEHPKNYIDGLQFMPNQDDSFTEKVHEFHKNRKNLTPADAEFQYLDNARKIPLYGMDLHEALDGDGTNIVIGVSGNGIHVILKGREMSKFSWSNIHKVYFKSKRFYLDVRVVTEVEYEDLTIGFRCRSRTELKRLYRSAVDHHTFFRRDALILGEQKVSFFRLGSRFRYSGKKTLQQLKTTTHTRPLQTFQRVSSQRLSSAQPRSKHEAAESRKKDSENKVKDTGSGAGTKHQINEVNSCEDDGSPSISRDVVIVPTEDSVKEKGNADKPKATNNCLAVKITISPPTPVPGERRTVDVDDSCEDFEVIESNENELEESDVTSDVKPSEDPPSQTEDSLSQAPRGEPEGQSGQEVETVEKQVIQRVETTDSESFEEITSRMETTTTVTTKTITKTEIITVDLNEETVVVEEEHIEENGTEPLES
ncbi:band 4.1-like protein 1 [Rhopilema esculentum]|uniref:band 4.1-like protein 1 n=1 Tax=Rhopilema esculentum TaxID=499914 RepID=UPI0031DAF860